MNVRRLLSIAAVTLAMAVTAGASIAFAQDAMFIDTPFAFKVGTNTFQPGKYELTVSADQAVLTIQPAKGAATAAGVVTSLGMPELKISEARAVFDKVGAVYYLSEFWVPGYDGYLVHVTKGKHTHVSVKAAKKG